MLKNSNLVSDEYIQENILGISNTNEMQRQIIENQAGAGLTQYVIAQEMEKLQQHPKGTSSDLHSPSAAPFGQGLSQPLGGGEASADLRSGLHLPSHTSAGLGLSQSHMDRDVASADRPSGRHSPQPLGGGEASQALTAGQASQRMMNELRAGATPGLAGLDEIGRAHV